MGRILFATYDTAVSYRPDRPPPRNVTEMMWQDCIRYPTAPVFPLHTPGSDWGAPGHDSSPLSPCAMIFKDASILRPTNTTLVQWCDSFVNEADFNPSAPGPRRSPTIITKETAIARWQACMQGCSNFISLGIVQTSVPVPQLPTSFCEQVLSVEWVPLKERHLVYIECARATDLTYLIDNFDLMLPPFL
uniref:Uncharacterized protein n=1 Tax=Haptolina brevifila TaxID=156173 RepID=A0A7S2H5U1_9EUKA